MNLSEMLELQNDFNEKQFYYFQMLYKWSTKI